MHTLPHLGLRWIFDSIQQRVPSSFAVLSVFNGQFSLLFLEQRELPADIGLLGKHHAKAFIHHLQTEAKTPYHGKPLSCSTVQGYVRTLKAFFSCIHCTCSDFFQRYRSFVQCTPPRTCPLILGGENTKGGGILATFQLLVIRAGYAWYPFR